MKFSDVCFLNFKYNLRKYIAYFVSTLFSCTVFFIYSSLLFNETVETEISKIGRDAAFIKNLMVTVLVIVWGFSLFFISYSYSSFLKTRNREFALYLTLGMRRKDIARIVVFEIAAIMLLSMIIGYIISYVISGPFYLLVRSVLGFHHIQFLLTPTGNIINILAFIIIFCILIYVSYHGIYKLNIIDLFKYSSMGDTFLEKPNYKSIVGIVLILLSLWINTISGIPMFFMVSVLICIIGLYLTITQLSCLLIALFSKYKLLYYRKLLSLTELAYKFSQFRKIVLISTVLSIFIIFFIGLSYSFLRQTEKNINITQPYDLMLLSGDKNKDHTKEQLEELANEMNIELLSYKTVNFLELDMVGRNNSEKKFILSESDYNNLSKSTVDVGEMEYVTITQRINPERNPWYTGPIEFRSDYSTYTLQYREEIWDIVINDSQQFNRFFVISDKQFDMISQKIEKERSVCCFIYNYNSTDHSNEFLEAVRKIDHTIVISKEENLQIEISKNSFVLFILCFIGLLFFVSIGFVLYYKVVTDIGDTQDKYKRIRRIGIENKQINKIISFELRILFFIPVILGSFIGVMLIISQTIKTMEFNTGILVNSLSVVIVYVLLQMIYYLLAKRKYLSGILMDKIN